MISWSADFLESRSQIDPITFGQPVASSVFRRTRRDCPMQDKPLRFLPRCTYCGKPKQHHRAATLECPQGRRTLAGYRAFGPTRFSAATASETGSTSGDPARASKK